MEKKTWGPSFFKALLDFTTRLRLPPVFVRDYGESLHGYAKLRASSGETWISKLEEEIYDDGKCLCFVGDGWRKFVKDLELKMGEFLLFDFNVCNSTFDVSVFDHDFCERLIPGDGNEGGDSKILKRRGKGKAPTNLVDVEFDSDGVEGDHSKILRGRGKGKAPMNLVDVESDSDGDEGDYSKILRGKGKGKAPVNLVDVESDSDGDEGEYSKILRGKGKGKAPVNLVDVESDSDDEGDYSKILRGKGKGKAPVNIVDVESDSDSDEGDHSKILKGRGKGRLPMNLVNVESDSSDDDGSETLGGRGNFVDVDDEDDDSE